jgi:hypothetical protein
MSSIKVKFYADYGVQVIFGLMTLQKWQFDALMQCIKRNKEAGKFEVVDLYLDKHDNTRVSIKGVTKETFPQFLQMLECETLTTIQPEYILRNMIDKGMIVE